jgi:protein TonB
MKNKKSFKARLENKRLIFFEIGLIIALSIVLCSFEVKSEKRATNLSDITMDELIDYDIDITRQDEKKPEPEKPEPPKKEDVFDEMKILDDNTREKTGVTFSSEDEGKIVTEFKPVNEPVEKTEPVPFYKIEKTPVFPGGSTGMLKFISSNVEYPRICVKEGISGIVYVRFVVDETGKVTNVELQRSVDPYLDKAALDVVKSMPDWKPGKQNDKNVAVWQVIPIKFVLE